MKRIPRKAQHSLVFAPKVLICSCDRRSGFPPQPLHFRCSYGSTVHLSKIMISAGLLRPPTKRVNRHRLRLHVHRRVQYSKRYSTIVKASRPENQNFSHFFSPPRSQLKTQPSRLTTPCPLEAIQTSKIKGQTPEIAPHPHSTLKTHDSIQSADSRGWTQIWTMPFPT
jgi:hypothetical protein